MDIRSSPARFKNLHDQPSNLYAGWSAVACVAEVERLRLEYIHWKYPDAEPRLQRTVAVIQLKRG